MDLPEYTVKFLFRSLMAFIVLYAEYCIFDPFKQGNMELDTVNFLVFGIMVPIILIGFTLMSCFIVGLLALFPCFQNWLIKLSYLPLFMFLSGLFLLILSGMNHFREEITITDNFGILRKLSLADEVLALPGWLLSAFGLSRVRWEAIAGFISSRWDFWNQSK